MAAASGRFVLRIAPLLHDRLRAEAARRGCSLNQLCGELLERGLAGGALGGALPRVAAAVAPPELVVKIAETFRGKLEGVVLFGSAARGEMWDSSDVDLLLVLRRGIALTRRWYSIWDARIAAAAAGSVSRISPHFAVLPREAEQAGGLWYEVALDGVILWDPEGRVARLLARLRRRIAEGAVVRKLAHGQPYWERRAGAA